MKGQSHMTVTRLAFDLLAGMNYTFPILPQRDAVACASKGTDDLTDMEFIDVEGGVGAGGRDNPHNDQWDAIDDKPHHTESGYNFTTFNHFIDIKKGPGTYDDFDGYSYEYGSAKDAQYERADEEMHHPVVVILNSVLDAWPGASTVKVDEGLNWWLNDEYVHAPGQRWYRGCSPAVEQYSYYADKGVYTSVAEEAVERFPRAKSTGAFGRGIPYSVFMPVDNMARYWYAIYEIERIPGCLGPVMHAIQDVDIPHHSAGYMGNWHGKYEADLDKKLLGWTNDPAFINEVKLLFDQWINAASSSPVSLSQSDWSLTPCLSWRMDMLVTWLALNAYHAYDAVYSHFRNGYLLNEASMRDLAVKATAMSMLAIAKAEGLSVALAPTRLPGESWFWLLH